MVTCGTIEVLPAFDAGAVEIVNCNVDTNTAVAGEDTVNATVEVRNNNSNATASATVDFSADNVEDLSKEVSDVSEKLEQNDYDLGQALAEARENQSDDTSTDRDSEA